MTAISLQIFLDINENLLCSLRKRYKHKKIRKLAYLSDAAYSVVIIFGNGFTPSASNCAT